VAGKGAAEVRAPDSREAGFATAGAGPVVPKAKEEPQRKPKQPEKAIVASFSSPQIF
jgi:hypothetical protein